MPSPMLETLIVGLTAPTFRAVYRARTEPQVRHYAHGCDHVSNVALTITVIAVRCAQASQFKLALTSPHFKRHQALSGGFLTFLPALNQHRFSDNFQVFGFRKDICRPLFWYGNAHGYPFSHIRKLLDRIYDSETSAPLMFLVELNNVVFL